MCAGKELAEIALGIWTLSCTASVTSELQMPTCSFVTVQDGIGRHTYDATGAEKQAEEGRERTDSFIL